jgi:hypothetical protein
MRFSRYDLGADVRASHNHSTIPEVKMLCGGRMLSLRALGNEKQSVHPSRVAIKTLDLRTTYCTDFGILCAHAQLLICETVIASQVPSWHRDAAQLVYSCTSLSSALSSA